MRIETWQRPKGDEELALCRVFIIALARHPDPAFAVIFERWVDFKRQRETRPWPCPRSGRIAGLRHKVRDNTMPGQILVPPLLGQKYKTVHILWRELREQLDHDPTFI